MLELTGKFIAAKKAVASRLTNLRAAARVWLDAHKPLIAAGLFVSGLVAGLFLRR